MIPACFIDYSKVRQIPLTIYISLLVSLNYLKNQQQLLSFTENITYSKRANLSIIIATLNTHVCSNIMVNVAGLQQKK